MSKAVKRILMVMAFAWAGCAAAGPITDTVIVDGTEWAQVDLFLGISWSEINVVCPAGVCGSGALSGYDMDGWSWATVENMNQLFNHYIGFQALGPGPDEWFGPANDFTVTAAFFADGWRRTGELFGDYTMGLVADSDAVAPYIAYVVVSLVTPGDSAGTDNLLGSFTPPATKGAWFFRTGEPNSVASPATTLLIAIGLVSLGFSRRKRPQSR